MPSILFQPHVSVSEFANKILEWEKQHAKRDIVARRLFNYTVMTQQQQQSINHHNNADFFINKITGGGAACPPNYSMQQKYEGEDSIDKQKGWGWYKSSALMKGSKFKGKCTYAQEKEIKEKDLQSSQKCAVVYLNENQKKDLQIHFDKQTGKWYKEKKTFLGKKKENLDSKAKFASSKDLEASPWNVLHQKPEDKSNILLPPYYIYVVDEFDNIYAAQVELPGSFNHSSFLAGKPVKCAGELRFNDGKLVKINNKSGHYQPSICCVYNLLDHLKENYNISNVLINTDPDILDESEQETVKRHNEQVERPSAEKRPTSPAAVPKAKDKCVVM